MDKERPENQRVRNGFMLNPPAEMKVAYDSGVRNWFDPALIQEAARGDEARRFTGLDHQHAQEPGAPRSTEEQDRARCGRQQPDPHRRRVDVRK